MFILLFILTMPYRCSALSCKSNYPNRRKVSVFSFPKNPQLRQKWIQALNRGNFTPSKSSKVCELHFEEDLIERITACQNPMTGEILRCTLKVPRLVPGAIPNKNVYDLPNKLPISIGANKHVSKLDTQSIGGAVPRKKADRSPSQSVNDNVVKPNSDISITAIPSLLLAPSADLNSCRRSKRPGGNQLVDGLDSNDKLKLRKLLEEPTRPPDKDVPTEDRGYTSMVIVKEDEDFEEEHVDSVDGSKCDRMDDTKLEESFLVYNPLQMESTSHLSTIFKEEPATPLSGSSPRQSTSLVSDKESNSVSLDSTEINSQMCRLCLGEEPGMWSFFSVLTFEDQSTLDVVEVFQFLTGETVQQVDNCQLPSKICRNCVNLLVNAYNFQQRYERSKVILSKYIPKSYDSSQPYTVNTESITSQDVKDKIESNQFDEESLEFPEQSGDIYPTKYGLDITNFVGDGNKVPKLHRCPICPQKFTALELKQHCRSHKALKRYLNGAPKFNRKVRFYAKPRTKNVCLFYREKVLHSCPFCSEEFAAEEFKEHAKQHRMEGNFRCNLCPRMFLGRNHLKMHQLSHRKEAPFKCQECGKGFFQQDNFNFHMLRHTSPLDLPYKCQYCEKAFSNPVHLKRHIFGHEKDVSYQQYYQPYNAPPQCKKCLQKFKTQSQLQKHDCRIFCAKCHKTFYKRNTFLTHTCKYRTKLSLSRCDPSGNVSSAKGHKYRYSYKLLCYVCGKNVSSMKQHLQSHYPQKKSYVSCAQCQKQFRSKRGLSQHVKYVHVAEVSFRCQYCPKGFKSRRNLTVHERTHTGVREHICNICNKDFLEKSYLKRHLRKVHFKVDHKKDTDADDLSNLFK